MLETSMCYKQDILKYIADYFSSNWVYKELFSIALLCCISDIHVWHPSTPPPPTLSQSTSVLYQIQTI